MFPLAPQVKISVEPENSEADVKHCYIEAVRLRQMNRREGSITLAGLIYGVRINYGSPIYGLDANISCSKNLLSRRVFLLSRLPLHSVERSSAALLMLYRIRYRQWMYSPWNLFKTMAI